MIRATALALLATGLAGAQFVEIDVDAAVSAGKIRPTFGVEAPSDQRQARLLLESGLDVPVRVGADAALRLRLMEELHSAWADDVARVPRDDCSPRTLDAEPAVCALPPEATPIDIVDLAMALQDAAALAVYYTRREKGWFGSDGEPTAALGSLALAARLSASPRRIGLRTSTGSIRGLAGVSEDGEEIRILLTRRARDSDEPAPPAYLLHVRNLRWGAGSFAVERYRVSEAQSPELVEKGSGRGGMARVSARFDAPALELVVLRRQQAAPGSGVIRSRRRPSGP